jgi:hypothetical protein
MVDCLAGRAEVRSAEGDPGAFTFRVARYTRQVMKITTNSGTLTTELLP